MNNMISRVTLYDMLAMVIPGFLILLFFYSVSMEYEAYEHTCNWVFIFIVFIASYLTGLVWHKLMECLFKPLKFRNNEPCIEAAAKKFIEKYREDGGNAEQLPFQHKNRYEYYRSYYYLMKQGALNSIPVLEAQVVFIKNMLLIILFYSFALLCCESRIYQFVKEVLSVPCLLAISLVSLLIVMLILLYNIQNRIYYLVWEGYTYLKETENKETGFK
jgi:hypothetical protein